MKLMMTTEATILVYDGKRLHEAGKGRSWPAVSGPHGKGPAPAGEYTVEPPKKLLPTEAPYRDKKGFAWFAPMKPVFQTERSGFGIHPDGNVPGTLGCIGLTQDDTKEVFEWLGKCPAPVVLYVL